MCCEERLRSWTSAEATSSGAASITTTWRSWASLLNLRTDRGKELLAELVAVSDAVTENFAAGVLDRLGFGYDRLAERSRPDIVYVSNCGFGHAGPYRKYKTWGPIVQACCGLTFTSGLPDMPSAGLGLLLHGPSRRATSWPWPSWPG